jgi:hypothetical protein
MDTESHTLVFASEFERSSRKCLNIGMDGLTLENDLLPDLTSGTRSRQLAWCRCRRHNSHSHPRCRSPSTCSCTQIDSMCPLVLPPSALHFYREMPSWWLIDPKPRPTSSLLARASHSSYAAAAMGYNTRTEGRGRGRGSMGLELEGRRLLGSGGPRILSVGIPHKKN